MPYILSPEQKVVLDALTSKEASSTKYFDIHTAMQTLCRACTSFLVDGKKILIHLPDNQHKTLLHTLFEGNGLNDLTIDISSNEAIPEVDIIKLRSTLKKSQDTDSIIKYVLSQKRADTYKKQIKNYYQAFDSKVMSDTPFRDFVLNYIYQKKEGDLITVDHSMELQFTANEYYKAKKEINTAVQLYQKRFDLFDYLSLLKAEIWEGLNEAKIAEIKSQLTKLKEESSLLHKDFIATTKNLTKAASKELTSTIAHLELKFIQHEEACIAYHIKSNAVNDKKEGKFSLFAKKKSQPTNKIYVEAFDELSGLIQNISKEWFNELDAPTTDMITYEYIIEFITKNKEKTASVKSLSITNLKDSINRINKINTTSEAVQSLDKRLEKLINTMNASHLFDLELDHNILSFVKQAELSKHISEYLERCNILVNSSSAFLEWKSFYNAASDVFKLIFTELKKLPKEQWSTNFEHWYKDQIQHHVLDATTLTPNQLTDYYTHSTTELESEVSAVIARLQPSRLAAIDALKSMAKELHNTLLKKKQLPGASWYNTALMNRPFMQDFFPIHITQSMAHAKEYDVVISFSIEETADVNAFSPIESKDIQDLAENKHNFLYLNDYNYNHPLRELSSTDKLKASKKLAKYILSLNQNIKIFQLKNANIISLLPSYDDTHLENELDKINAKVIDTHGVLYDRLTESILFTERRPFLIIKDELINSELHHHALWQLQLIQLFQQVGYEVISINTLDQLEDNKAQFDQFLQKVKGEQSGSEELVNQNPEQPETIIESA